MKKPNFVRMILIESYAVDRQKWDGLVSRSGNSFQMSWYLDATAKNWCVITDSDYSKGIILSYNQILKQKLLYPPVYGRTQQFLGMDADDIRETLKLIEDTFKVGILQLHEVLPERKAEMKTYQTLQKISLNKLAQRMLKRSHEANISIRPIGWEEGFHLIAEELAPKVESIQGENLNRLKHLMQAAHDRNTLISTGIFRNDKLEGSLYFIQEEYGVRYLKGAAKLDNKNLGGMYLGMHEAITQALASNKRFDFGGSSIPGIRRFFMAFGGEDVIYYQYQWDRSPLWFRILRKIVRMVR